MEMSNFLFEYLENRSLDIFLFDPVNRRLLPWLTRYNIIDEVARGLAYIHLVMSCFGLARILGDDQTHAYTCHKVGTRRLSVERRTVVAFLTSQVVRRRLAMKGRYCSL
ncbi:putative non-specific serine/threonine protein kinase [Dioscorea sansibarensis]